MKRYRPRIDTMPLILLLLATFIVDVAAIGVISPVLGQERPWSPLLWFLIATGVPVVLTFTIVPVRYRLDHHQLEVRSGLSIRWRIRVSEIHRIVPVVSLRPAPALSVQRLRIDYLDGTKVRSLQIAPHEPHQMLRELVAIDGQLHLEEEGALVRHGGRVLLFDTLAS